MRPIAEVTAYLIARRGSVGAAPPDRRPRRGRLCGVPRTSKSAAGPGLRSVWKLRAALGKQETFSPRPPPAHPRLKSADESATARTTTRTDSTGTTEKSDGQSNETATTERFRAGRRHGARARRPRTRGQGTSETVADQAPDRYADGLGGRGRAGPRRASVAAPGVSNEAGPASPTAYRLCDKFDEIVEADHVRTPRSRPAAPIPRQPSLPLQGVIGKLATACSAA